MMIVTLLAGASLCAGVAASCATGAGFDLTDDNNVRSLYRLRCGACHAPYDPDDYSPEDWPDIVDDWRDEAGLTDSQRDAIVAWLVRESS